MKYTARIGKNAGVIRKITGLTQVEMAEAIGISRPTWSKMENGKQEINNSYAIALFAYSTEKAKHDKDEINQQMLKAIFGIEELELAQFMEQLTKEA